MDIEKKMTEKMGDAKVNKIYSFDEAIDLTGTGWYNVGMMVTGSLCLLAMGVDLFSFSAVIPLCTCDFKLDMMQKSILVSMPFLGPILTAYIWGYISDTRGRKLTLVIGMFVSFVMSTLCAFAPNWIALAIFKLIGTCFSSCAQSATFALLGESCPERSKSKFLIIMSSAAQLAMPVYIVASYLIGNLSFSYDIGLITFVPWRLLVIVLALPLALCTVAVSLFHESPKFLLNADKEEEAVRVLKSIYRRNGGRRNGYPVEKVILTEQGNVRTKGVPLMQSLRDQTLPLFKPPLLWNTLLLYYAIAVVYSVGGGLYIWLPFIAHAFSGNDNSTDFSHGICSAITENNSIGDNGAADNCKAADLTLAVATIISGSTYCILSGLMSKLAARKRLLLQSIFIFAAVMCFLSTVIPNRGSGFAYLGVLVISLGMAPVFAYYVDLYPTSFRGMAACLGVMFSRLSSVAGINLIGPFITTQCNITFYALSAFALSGAVIAFLLPSDKKKTLNN